MIEKDIINELKNIHDRLDNIGIEARNLRNVIRGIIKKVNTNETNPIPIRPTGNSKTPI